MYTVYPNDRIQNVESSVVTRGGPARIMNMSSYARYDIIISEQWRVPLNYLLILLIMTGCLSVK